MVERAFRDDRVEIDLDGPYVGQVERCLASMWGTAADIYRIGDELMDSREKIEKYIRVARDLLPGVWTRPFGQGPGFAFDHVHVDLGFVTVIPHDAPAEEGDR